MKLLETTTALSALATAVVLFGCCDQRGFPDAIEPSDAAGDIGLDPLRDTSVGEDPDVGGVDSMDAEPEVVSCEPNTIVRCMIENTPHIERCNFRGNEVFQTTCEGLAVCREAQCFDVTCIPGDRVCQGDQQPLTCNDEGTEFVPQAPCEDGAICTEGRCIEPCEIAELTNSYIGCEYWPVELENGLLEEEDELSTPAAPFAVVLANPGMDPALVTVRSPDGSVHEAIPEVFIRVSLLDPRYESTTVYTEIVDSDGTRIGEPLTGLLEDVMVPPGASMQILFPRMQPDEYASSLKRIAWHIVSNRPVVAYQFNPICCNYSFSNDASLLLPKGTLTSNYTVMSYPNWTHPDSSNAEQPGHMAVVAIEDDTEVTIRLSDPRIREGDGVPVPDGQGVMTLTMQAQEVLNLATSPETPVMDLTGSVVEASKPVAVFGAHSCTFIPTTNSACDHIEQQMFPRETWGMSYVAAPLKLRRDNPNLREATYWKILAGADGALIELDRPFDQLQPKPKSSAGVDCRDRLARADAIQLDAGEFCEFGTRVGFALSSDVPFLLGAFMSGQESTGDLEFGSLTGDPAFFLVPPREQYRTEYDFLTPATYALDFVTIVASTGARLELDGQAIDLTTYEHEIIETQNLISAHVPLDDGPHHLSSASRFGIVVYAYDDFVSYAYTGGLDLVKLTVIDP